MMFWSHWGLFWNKKRSCFTECLKDESEKLKSALEYSNVAASADFFHSLFPWIVVDDDDSVVPTKFYLEECSPSSSQRDRLEPRLMLQSQAELLEGAPLSSEKTRPTSHLADTAFKIILVYHRCLLAPLMCGAHIKQSNLQNFTA